MGEPEKGADMEFAPLLGWMRGPDYQQRFRGWVVLSERETAVDWPVTIIAGHTRAPHPTAAPPSLDVEALAKEIAISAMQAEHPGGFNFQPNQTYVDRFVAILRAHLSAAAPLEGWRPISEFQGEEHSSWLVTGDDGECVGEATWHCEDGWWWANNDPADSWGSRIYPTHFVALPLPPVSHK